MKTAHCANIKPGRKPKLGGPGARSFSVTIEARMPSEIDAISPLMDQLMRLIEGSCCVVGGEFAVYPSLPNLFDSFDCFDVFRFNISDF
jgi:hypothetical protein